MIEHGILKGNNTNIIHGILKIVKLTNETYAKTINIAHCIVRLNLHARTKQLPHPFPINDVVVRS